MTKYVVTYANGAQTAVELLGMRESPSAVLIAAEKAGGQRPGNAVTIQREIGGNLSVMWQRVATPAPSPVLLFVSFAYELPWQATCGAKSAAHFGNTVVEIEFEPKEGPHIARLQLDIAAYLAQSGEPAESVTILAWQKLAR